MARSEPCARSRKSATGYPRSGARRRLSLSVHILGISTLGRSSAVTLIDEHSVLFAIEEEKLSRQESPDIPRLALERCLHENQLKLSDCRAIALAGRSDPSPRARRRTKHPERTAFEQQLQQLL